LLQLLPSSRPADLNILYIRWMYLIKRFTDMEVSGRRVRRITGFVRESTRGYMELRQASFCDRKDKCSWKITTCLSNIHLRWYFMHFTAASHKPARLGMRQGRFKVCLLNGSWCSNRLLGIGWR
jgi:hypothetical protein